MDTVLANKISKFFLNLQKVSYSNPFVSPNVLKAARKLQIRLVPKSMGYDGCAPLGFYQNKMCEIIFSDLELTDAHFEHLKKIATCWQMCPHLLYVDHLTNNLIRVEQYSINKKRKRQSDLVQDEQIEIPDSNWVTASSTRNYMLDDPIIDYLKFQAQEQKKIRSRSSSSSRSRSNSETFLEKIFENGNKFEEDIINKIKQMIPTKDFITIAKSYEARDINKYKQTIQAIRKSIPVIYQPVLWNHTNKTYGCADLIIRSDYAEKIFPSYPVAKQQQSAPTYEVYDIKWSNLKLKAGSDHLQNEISVKPYKAQIWIYTDALNKIQTSQATRGFIIGKSYYRENTVNKQICTQTYSDPFEKLGMVDWSNFAEEENIEKTNEAIQWLQEVRTNKLLELDPPNDPRLYPNMKNTSDGEFHSTKKRLAEKNKEITMLYSVGKRSRDLALKSGILRWDDPRINSHVLGFNPNSKLAGLIDGIINTNRWDNTNPISYSELSNFGNWKNSKVMCYVDIETIGKTVYSLPIDRSNFIFMIGLGVSIDNKWTHYVYTAKSLDLNEENRILKEFNLQMGLIAKQMNSNETIPIFHWSNYENTNLKPFVNISPQFEFYDMCKWFKDDQICVKGAFDFKLKSITRALYKLGLSQVVWDDTVSNGMDAMNQAYNYYVLGGSEQIIKDIEAYNEVDCRSMAEIHQVLKTLI
jgi:predicted RecB family nuclease